MAVQKMCNISNFQQCTVILMKQINEAPKNTAEIFIVAKP
jgi:hypothetical protein